MQRTLRRNLYIIIGILLILMVAISCTLSFAGGKEKADSAVISNADTITTDLLMPDKSTRGNKEGDSVFNGNALSELYAKLAGTGADFAKIKALASTTKSAYSQNSVKSIHSGMDSGDIRQAVQQSTGTANNLVVKLDGKEWIVTALTTDTNNNVILTLWLKDVAYNSVWNKWTPPTVYDFSATYPATMYSSSYIRAGLLNGTKKYSSSNGASLANFTDSIYGGAYPFSIYTDSAATGSITNFLVAPNQVEYQKYENLFDISAGKQSGVWYNAPNDAASATIVGDKWYSVKVDGRYQTHTIQTKTGINGEQGYFDWGNDLIWLPSLSETGQTAGNGCNQDGGLWNLDNGQRGCSAGKLSWLRSGYTFATNAYYLDAAGVTYLTTVSSPSGTGGGSLAVRPALNLNLSSAALSAATLFEEPSNVSLTYNGATQTFDSGTTKPTWYTNSFETAVSNRKISVAYKDSQGNTMNGAPIDAGTYKVEFTISDTTGKFLWKNYTSNTNTSREITFTINPKQIGFTIKGGGTTLPTVEHDVKDLAGPDSGSQQGTILDFHYDSDPGTNPVYDVDFVAPTREGAYTATVIAKNKNYAPRSDLDPKKKFTVTAQQLTVPTFKNATHVYTGRAITFELDNFDSNKMEIVIDTQDTNVINKIDDNAVQVKDVKVGGKYKIKVALKDKQGSMYWNSGTRNDNADKEIEFEVTPYKIAVDLTTDNGIIKVDGGTKTRIEGLITGTTLNNESVKIDFEAQRSSRKCSLFSGLPVVANDPINIELATDNTSLDDGEWNLVLISDNANYEIAVTPSNIKLDVQTKAAIATPRWALKRNGSIIDTSISVTEGDSTPKVYNKSISYNARNTYVFNLLCAGYTIDTTYGTGGYLVVPSNSQNIKHGVNADTYTTSVKIIDSEGNDFIYSIQWTIDPVKYDLSGVKWLHDGGSGANLPYDKVGGSKAELDPKTLPDGLVPTYSNNTGAVVGDNGSASVTFALDNAYEGNYVLPDESDPSTYDGSFDWSKTWTIVKATIQSNSWKNSTVTDVNNHAFDVPVLRDPNADGGIVEYEYYETDAMGNIIDNTPKDISQIVWSESEAKYYVAKPILKDSSNYDLDNANSQSKVFRVGKDLIKVSVTLNNPTVEYNTNPRHAKITVTGGLSTNDFELTYYDGYTRLSTAPTQVGKYRVEVGLKSSFIDKYQIDGDYEFDFEIVKAQIAVEWNTNAKPNVLKLSYGQINGVEYEIVETVDGADVAVSFKDLQVGKTYKIKAKIKDNQLGNFIFADGTVETGWQEFSIANNDTLYDPNSPSNPSYPKVDPDLPTDGDGNGDGTGSGNIYSGNNGGSGSLDLGKIGEFFKNYWQPILALISILLIIIFTSKGISYASKRKKVKKTIEKKYSSYYAIAGMGLFNMPNSIWTIVAGILAGVAVLSFVFMLLEKKMYTNVEDELDEAKDDYLRREKDLDERKREAEYSRRDDEYRRRRDEDNMRREEEYRRRDEDMQMMFMRMMGGGNVGPDGNPQGVYMGMQRGIAPDDVRAIITDTVTALLPGMQQLLPQPAANNDKTIKELIAQNDKNMQKMMEKNDERMDQMMKNQEILITKLLERSDERAVVATVAEPQVVEKIIEKEVPVEVEKIVEKVVEVPVEVEKIVEKEVKVEVPVEKVVEKEVIKEVPVEKVVEKEIIKEVPVEKIVEVPVEKVVEKEVVKEVKVEVPVEKIVEKEVVKEVKVPVAMAVTSNKVKKESAPRLTLDEAYAQLSKQQQKYFDGLREYALKKEKAKEKKSTYAIVIGQSTANPLIKLTIKKDMTVALFKMEDEYLKDIKRDATSDGTKVKVKETEVMIGDAQACKTAKNMIDLREDQIERYQDLLKEQRIMKRLS